MSNTFDESTGEVILYQKDDGAPAIDVRLEYQTVWLSQRQIADLFQSSRTNIAEHIRCISEEGELDELATCRKSRQVRTEGTRLVSCEVPVYNLDLIISVGCRVKSKVATRFRIWATGVSARSVTSNRAASGRGPLHCVHRAWSRRRSKC